MSDDVRADARRLLQTLGPLEVTRAGAPTLIARLLAELDRSESDVVLTNVELGSALAERDAALAVIANIREQAADVDQDGGYSGPAFARHILNIIGGEK
ncbi:hypothetical protein SEA_PHORBESPHLOWER_59 [Gordonia phage PhorbesPhlower]|nr:hypothetical protein SEA_PHORBESPHLOWER_59 [Gordonia phage PhorbesPhlower]